jgi:tRNA G46 methylase TrmB
MSTKRNRNIHKGTKKIYINKLKHLYPSCKFDKAHLLYNNNRTYGEMEYEGIQKLYNFVTKNFNPSINCFMDIGSGRGKLCMYMAAQPKITRVLGIEFMKERHEDAEILKSELKSEYSDKVTLLNKNVLKINFDDYKDSNIFIWFSNLCFDQSLVNTIFQKLKNELPVGTILCCSKQPQPIVGTFLDFVKVKMSWDKSSAVFIYRL